MVYDENLQPIGNERRDDKLKTLESYRRIPVSNHLLEVLLKHKQNQKQRFKESIKMNKKGRRWNEKEYMFLSRTYKPYVADTLSSALPKFCNKYNLERISPYGLRHSFATNFSYKNDDAIALQAIMGHSDYSTTQKNYIKVFADRKREAMNKVFAKYNT